jgi:hypothetical protein
MNANIQLVREKLFLLEEVIERFDATTKTVSERRWFYEMLRRSAGAPPEQQEEAKAKMFAAQEQMEMCEEIVLYISGCDTLQEARHTFMNLSIAYGHLGDLHKQLVARQTMLDVINDSDTIREEEKLDQEFKVNDMITKIGILQKQMVAAESRIDKISGMMNMPMQPSEIIPSRLVLS